MNWIKVGTLLSGFDTHQIPELLPHGFECFSLTFWETCAGYDFEERAQRVREMLDGTGAQISALSVFGNPLIDSECEDSWKALIDNAERFDCDIVSGFAGRIPDCSIDQSMKRFKKVFGELARRAADNGVRLAFENCDMDGDWESGDWNIAHNPIAWEMMFNEVPDDNVGLEWEPCHQMVSLIDPIPQLRKWVCKVFHVHGKDATVCWDIVREYGVHGPRQFAFHRTPGFGDTNWADICTILMQHGYRGTIDIEGWHDPVFRDELEYTAQVESLKYLKRCRGGEVYVRNPK